MSEKPSFYKWELLALLFCAYFFHQADRAIFGVVTEDIQSDLGLTNTQIGLTGSVLFLVLALMVPIAGFVGDRYSRKWIITGSILFWSVSTMLTGFCRGLYDLIFFRSVATAGGESFYGPASTALIASYHKSTRALALSIHQASLYIGVMCSGFLAGWMAENWGWRSAFYVFGAMGVVIGLLFIPRLKDAPKEQTPEKPEPEKHISPWAIAWILVRIPTVLLLTCGFIAVVFVNNAYVIWAPKLLASQFALGKIEAGGYSMFYHHLGALIFILIGGTVSDLMVRRLPTFRVHLQWLTMFCGVPLIYFIGNSPTLFYALTAMFLFGVTRGLYESNTHAAIFEVVPSKYRASLVGLMIMAAFLIGSTSPLLLGKLQDVYGAAQGFSIGFAVLACSWIIGGIMVFSAAMFTFKKDKYRMDLREEQE